MIMLIDWELVNTRWDCHLNMLTLELVGIPHGQHENVHELTAAEVEQLKEKAVKYLNTFVHTDCANGE